LKRGPVLKQIPVVVLTTSTDERDIQDCYRRGANSYMQKPFDFEGFMKAVSGLSNYWFEVVVLPNPVEDA
ncbi:MAG: response regulator, partial [Nitrospirota bacterium]|nr:response regulator [Nitrospirota bacterium]